MLSVKHKKIVQIHPAQRGYTSFFLFAFAHHLTLTFLLFAQRWQLKALEPPKTPHTVQGSVGSWYRPSLRTLLGLQMHLSWEALAVHQILTS